jgi:CheY-like chemotaxis protein
LTARTRNPGQVVGIAPTFPSVLIVDDHPVVRMGLRAVIEQSGGYEVVGAPAQPAGRWSRRRFAGPAFERAANVP